MYYIKGKLPLVKIITISQRSREIIISRRAPLAAQHHIINNATANNNTQTPTRPVLIGGCYTLFFYTKTMLYYLEVLIKSSISI
jgi:hypothetical protein